MNIASGKTLGHYKIVSSIGAGGMGEVYRAHDSRLAREVAIKLLPRDFAGDEERLRRFEQEAKATSALNHPNILTVYDIGELDGSPFIVAELLDGEELRDRLNEGPIPLRKVIGYAQQIVSGLSAAHEKGIVHRDLKPENLFITKDDRVKILDFGLAKLRGGTSAPTSSEDATRKQITNPGVIMGTVGYMSPEQVRAQGTDHRSDIFSFGSILHEMITGRRAFQRETMAETISAILKEEPEELSISNPSINPSLERIVRRCLEKKPERRFQSTADLGFALESLSMPMSSSGNNLTAAVTAFAEEEGGSPSRRIPWIAAAILLLGCVALAVLYLRRPIPDQSPIRFVVEMPDKAAEISRPIISPDGRTLAFIATVGGKRFIYVRPLDSVAANLLAGTDDADLPFWSPDNRHIGFFSNGKLKKIEATGGPPQSLCDVQSPFGGTWNREGVILVATPSGIQRLTASGGTPEVVLRLDESRHETEQWFPYFLPDGKHFLYYSWCTSSNEAAIYAASLDGSEYKPVLKNDSNVAYTPGFLLFARDNTLMAQPFNAGKLELSGEPFPVLERVTFSQYLSYSNFSVSENGTMFYWAGSISDRQLAWYDRSGKLLSNLGPPGGYSNIALSPDGKRVALQTGENLWQMDIARGVLSRFTFTSASNEDDPSWSPDGSSIIFTSYRDGIRSIYRKPSNGNGAEDLVAKIDCFDRGTDWSADGKFVLFTAMANSTNLDIWVLPMFGDMKPYPLLQTKFAECQGHFSPDGRWFVYTSDESGKNEIYVQSFPSAGGKWQVSTAGGAQPRWRRDGKEIFYVSSDRKLTSVEVKPGPTIETGAPHPLFQTRVTNYLSPDRYAVSADGQRFLVNSAAEETSQTPMTVILNWAAGIKK